MTPRRQITSQPYAIRALSAVTATTADSALNLGGTAANQFVQTTDSRLTNSRTPAGPAGGSLTGSYPNPAIAQKQLQAQTLPTAD